MVLDLRLALFSKASRGLTIQISFSLLFNIYDLGTSGVKSTHNTYVFNLNLSWVFNEVLLFKHNEERTDLDKIKQTFIGWGTRML